MAGIGFVLERILEHRGVRGLFAVTLAGAVIVAGPWLLTTLGLTLVSIAAADRLITFFAVIVYSYALSLIAFGGYHLVLTRRISDLMFGKHYNHIPQTIAGALVVSVVGGAALGSLVSIVGSAAGAFPAPLFLSTVAVFVTINAGWVVLILLSLMQRFQWTVAAYVAGALVTGGGVFLLGESTQDATALAVFGLGNAVTAIVLIVAAYLEARKNMPGMRILVLPRWVRMATRGRVGRRVGTRTGSRSGRKGRNETGSRDSQRTGTQSGAHVGNEAGSGDSPVATVSRTTTIVLFLIGFMQYFGLWIDKLVFWVGFGEPVLGTRLRLFEDYDRATFLAQLTLIPPMIHYVVRGETTMFRSVRKALRSIRTMPIKTVDATKAELADLRRDRRLEQVVIQVAVTIGVLFLSPELAGTQGAPVEEIGPRIALFGRTVIATQMYLLFYTVVLDLLYLGENGTALVVVSVVAVLNGLGAVATVFLGATDLVGGSFFTASLGGAVLAGTLLRRTVFDLDRRILTRSALG